MRTDDPLKDFLRRDAEQSRWLKKRPLCVRCGEYIQDESAVCIDDDYYCNACLKDLRVWIGDE